MADVEMHGSYEEAHGIADTGGEFCAAKEMDLGWLEWEWYTPAEDLSNIFVSMGYREVSPKVILACDMELYGEVHGVRLLGLDEARLDIVYAAWGKRSAFQVCVSKNRR
tara:strand:- start:126 stop:452 length:327 start_codon:yes stop_codon:yes gene_type:complete